MDSDFTRSIPTRDFLAMQVIPGGDFPEATPRLTWLSVEWLAAPRVPQRSLGAARAIRKSSWYGEALPHHTHLGSSFAWMKD